MTHRALNAAAWTPAEDDILIRAKLQGVTVNRIATLLTGRTPHSINARARELRGRGIDVGQPRTGRRVATGSASDQEYEAFRARTASSSAALLAAIVNLTAREMTHG